MKNATPLVVSRIVSLLIALFVFLALLALKLLVWQEMPWLAVAVVPALTLVFSYFLLNSYLERFLYRKIKLIYKSIYDAKIPEKEKSRSVDLSADVISDAETEVIEWKKKKTREDMRKKKLENYRKEFLGNVFHELKTPIFNIQGYLETLIEGGIDDPGINMKFLQRARKNVRRMTEIVDDLQMIANLEDGSFSLVEEKFDIFRLATDVMDSLDLRAEKKNISLEFKEGCDHTFMVRADRELIQQVLNNLITNSIKYGKEGGKSQIGLYDMNENILVEVSDNGIGIEQKHLPRIFERFYRVDKDRSRELGGSGLGLSIVKHIIEAHQQTLNVRSTKGVGTTFGFTLEKA